MTDIRAAIGGAGGGKGTAPAPAAAAVAAPAHVPVEAPNTLRSAATALVVDLVSEGPIQGLVNGNYSVYFDNTPLIASSGAVNFSLVTVDARTGLPDQSVLLGFQDVESTEVVDTEATHAVSIVRTVDNVDADSARVTVRIPSLWRVDSTTGDVRGKQVQIQIYAKAAAGAYVLEVDQIINGKCVAPYERAFLISNLPSLGAGPWDIKLVRVSPDFDSVVVSGDTIFASLTTIVDHRLIYPDSALFGLHCDARSFGGGMPQRSYEIYGLQIQVPINYDPTTAVYSGSWNGTFKTVYSNNPAWVFYALATNVRFGLGEFLTAAQMDKWQLYTIAQYCDGLVPNGLGGLERRYTFNGIIADREEAYRVLMSLANVFRGMLYWSSGSVYATADMPVDPIQLVTPANVIGGEFNYQGQSLKARHTVALVSYINPADSYRQDIEVVEDIDAIEQFGYRQIEVVAVGCTSRGQARRYGRWILDTEANETEVVTYVCSWDHLNVFPGSLIEVADPAYAGVRMGGRIVLASSTSITIDDTLTIDGSQSYSVDVVLPTGAIANRALTNAAGDTTVLALATPLSPVPQVGAIWVVTASDLVPRQFRVVSVVETEKHLFEVSALFHDPNKYDRVELGLVVEDPVYTELPSGDIDHPTNITVRPYLYDSGAGVVLGAVEVSWSAPTDPRVTRYEVQTTRDDLEWQTVGYVDETSFTIDGIARTETSIGARVRAADDLGHSSEWLTNASIATTMFMAPPGDVTGLRSNIISDTALLTWTAVSALDFHHYIIRFAPVLTGATWGTAQILQSNVVATNTQLPAMIGTYLIKAVSKLGIESSNAALLVSNVASLSSINAVLTVDPAPGWSGTKFDVEVVASKIQLGGASNHYAMTHQPLSEPVRARRRLHPAYQPSRFLVKAAPFP